MFHLDIVTTTGGVITMSLTVEEALAAIGESLSSSEWLRAYLGDDATPAALLADKSVLRAALIASYGEDLGRVRAVTGHDDEGASWSVRTAEIVAIRVVDPDLAPQPPTPRQIGFRVARDDGATSDA